MKKLILILIAIALLTSCKTVKNNIREKSKTEVSIQNDIKEEVKVLEEVKISDNITQLTDELITIIEKIITVKLSAPDSLSNQHPTEITTTEREITKGKTVKYDANSRAEQTINTEIQKTDNSTENIKTVTEKIDKTTTKKTTPGWVYAIVIILTVGILLFVFIFLKKYRIL